MVGAGGERVAALGRLRGLLARLPRLALAFSGGIDSRFLCHMALACGCDVVALHGAGPQVPAEESADARAWAAARGLRLLVVAHDPLSLPEVAANSRERCYACKRALLAGMRDALTAAGEGGRVLCDGGNLDDQRAFRPGLRAVAEAGVRSPLAEAGLGKALIRELARETGLDRPDQPSRPCLLTRLAYGMRPDAPLLTRLAAAEAALAALDEADREAFGECAGLGEFRLRLVPAPLLQCNRLPERLAPAVKEALAAHGFAPFSVACAERVSGFFDASPA